MSQRRQRWQELQARWARGERLSADEERERLEYAALDPIARRELALFAELRGRAASDGAAFAPELIDGVLDAVQGRPRLRLVAPREQVAEAPLNQPRSRRARWSALLAAAALLVAAAVCVALVTSQTLAPRPVARMTSSKPALPPAARAALVLAAGDVLVDGSRVVAGPGPLREGQRLTTRDGTACLTIDSDVDVCLATDSAVRLQSLAAPSARLQVESGTALASLARQPAGRSFSLVLGNLVATARGTTFAGRREGGQSELIVLEGAVDVARGGGRHERVEAHSRVLLGPSGALERTLVGDGEAARLLALRSSHSLWAGGTSGVLQIFTAPSVALRVSIDDHVALPLPLQALVRAGGHRLTFRDPAGRGTSSWVDVVAGETQRVEPPLASAAAAAAEPADERSPAALLAAARREVGRGRPAQALALYERLRALYPDSAEAHTVLITMGKLELTLKRQARALRHFDAYLQQGGALAPEALTGKVGALRALGRRAEERSAMQQYLVRHPNGLSAPLFEKRLQEHERQ